LGLRHESWITTRTRSPEDQRTPSGDCRDEGPSREDPAASDTKGIETTTLHQPGKIIVDYKLFEEIRLSQVAKVPYRYSREVRWLPQIGDVVPDFNVDSTKGPISFHKFAEGNWVFLFSHPAAFTPVCTTEIASFATFAKDFEARGVKLLGISKSTIADQIRWHADIETIYDMHVTFPMIADEAGMLINLFGMLHNKQSPEWSIRKSIIIGPDLKIRMIFEYPILIGRSSDEMLRVIDALQTADTYNVATSADWRKGCQRRSNFRPKWSAPLKLDTIRRRF